MKKTIKLSAIALLLILLVAGACMHFGAATTFESDGFLYSVVSATTADLHGRTTDDADLVIPKEFSERYVVNIVDSAFQGDQNIESLSFAKATLLERVGFYSFKDCSNLSGTITFGGRINTLGYSAFEGCSSLESIVLRSYITDIPDQCFYQCSSLSSVDLNERVKTIGKFAFADCTSLEYVEIPRTVTSINETAFYGDENLTLGVWYGTTGYDYAIAQNIPYILLDGVKLGDANGDGIVNINDVTAIQQHLADYVFLEGIFLHAADADQNGEVKIDDATLLQEFLAEYQVAYSIGEVVTQ